MDELAGLGAVRASGVWLKSSLHMGELALYISFSRVLRNFGKWVMTSVRFSGSILSCSAVNRSISCRLMVRNTELRNIRPKMSVASYFCRLSQNTGTWQKLTHLV
jgi:hypothetical protein